MAASRTFLQSDTSGSDASEYTFSDQNLGVASSDRYIVVCCASRVGGSASALPTAVSVQGISATLVVRTQDNDTTTNSCGIFIASVPTGTTGHVVVTYEQTMVRSGISLYSITGADATAHDTDVDFNASPVATTIDVPADGLAIAACSVFPSLVTWAGLTEDDEVLPESNLTLGVASDEFVLAQTGLAVTASLSGATVYCGCVASFGPASGGGTNYDLLNADSRVSVSSAPSSLSANYILSNVDSKASVASSTEPLYIQYSLPNTESTASVVSESSNITTTLSLGNVDSNTSVVSESSNLSALLVLGNVDSKIPVVSEPSDLLVNNASIDLLNVDSRVSVSSSSNSLNITYGLLNTDSSVGVTSSLDALVVQYNLPNTDSNIQPVSGSDPMGSTRALLNADSRINVLSEPSDVLIGEFLPEGMIAYHYRIILTGSIPAEIPETAIYDQDGELITPQLGGFLLAEE